MRKAPDVYDRLKSTQIEGLSITQLNAATKDSFIEQDNVQFWGQAITLDRALESSRTYAHGLPIPEASAIVSQAIDAGNYYDLQPDGTQEFQILALSVTAAGGTDVGQVYLTDGSANVLMHAGATSTAESSFFPFEAPFTITNTLYLRLLNTSGSNAMTFKVGYNKVSM
jgi:hypothetical protein